MMVFGIHLSSFLALLSVLTSLSDRVCLSGASMPIFPGLPGSSWAFSMEGGVVEKKTWGP